MFFLSELSATELPLLLHCRNCHECTVTGYQVMGIPGELISLSKFFQPIINIFCCAEIPVTGTVYPDIINFIAVIF